MMLIDPSPNYLVVVVAVVDIDFPPVLHSYWCQIIWTQPLESCFSCHLYAVWSQLWLRIVTKNLMLMQPLMLLSWLICTISFDGISISDFSSTQNFFIYVEQKLSKREEKKNTNYDLYTHILSEMSAHAQNWICISHVFNVDWNSARWCALSLSFGLCAVERCGVSGRCLCNTISCVIRFRHHTLFPLCSIQHIC